MSEVNRRIWVDRPYLQPGLRGSVEVVTVWESDDAGNQRARRTLDVSDTFDRVAAALGYVEPRLNPEAGWERNDSWDDLVEGQRVRFTVGRSTIVGDFLHAFDVKGERRYDVVPDGSIASLFLSPDDGWLLYTEVGAQL